MLNHSGSIWNAWAGWARGVDSGRGRPPSLCCPHWEIYGKWWTTGFRPFRFWDKPIYQFLDGWCSCLTPSWRDKLETDMKLAGLDGCEDRWVWRFWLQVHSTSCYASNLKFPSAVFQMLRLLLNNRYSNFDERRLMDLLEHLPSGYIT